MNITILTLFPDMLKAVLDHSIVKRAQEKKLLSIKLIDIRDFSQDSYKSVDDHPYGGGVGMVMRVDVIDRALQTTVGKRILLDPQGNVYSQKKAQELSKLPDLVLICGHYEGVDERVRTLVDEEISIGDYILTGGEIPGLVLVDSITRLLPGVLADEATTNESFSGSLLEYPQYTRPENYKGEKVPTVLLSGDHKKINTWRAAEAKRKTKIRRPDLLKSKNK